MQIIITHGHAARTRVVCLSRVQLALAGSLLALLMLVLSGAMYHFIFLKAARDGWPVVSSLLKLVVRDEFAQRDRYMRDNLDAMARKVGEMQAKLVQLEAVGERVSGMVGIKPEELKSQELTKSQELKPGAKSPAQGGPFVPAQRPSFDELDRLMDALDESTQQRADMFTVIESRLFEQRMKALMVPNSKPVETHTSSGFGFRSDPFTGRQALHTGLDFPAEVGTPIRAAAGGVVLAAEPNGAYGNAIDLDHGNGLVTRYAHASRLVAKQGDLVKRGQVIALVGSSGRSTGPHLHFEVLLSGVPQDPAKFLARGGLPASPRLAAAGPPAMR